MESLTSLSNNTKLAMLDVPSIVSVDTEGVNSMMGISVAYDQIHQGFYLPFDHAQGNMTEQEKKWTFEILNKKEALVFHHAPHDLEVLRKAGFDYRGKFYDTLLMAHWINEEMMDYSLNSVSRFYGGQPKSMPDSMSMLIESDGWHSVPVALMDLYSSNDAYITHIAFREMLPLFQEQGFDGELWDYEQKFIRDVIIPMKRLGIKIDVDFCVKEWLRGTQIMQECTKELGFKPTPTTLEKFLIKELELPVVKHTKACKKCYPEDRRMAAHHVSTHTARPSFDKDAMEEYDLMLEKLDNEKAKTILRYRGWQKTTTSNYKPYMELMDENFLLHPGYKLHGTKTGRLSCAEPNLQQIPKSSDKDWNGGLKLAFIPRPTYGLWTIDYSQLQFRMTCSYAEQTELIKIFNDVTRDIFAEMAKQMAWLRDDVKTLVYLILFGGGANRASVAFTVPVAQGGELVNEFHSLYPEIKAISKEAEQAARRQHYVAYWTGRRRHFPRGSKFYRAFNSVIQGGEAEIIKRAMIRLAEEVCNDECRMVLQIHDEIAFEIKEGREDYYLPLCQKIMEEVCDDFCKYVGVNVKFKTSAKPWGEK